MKSKKVQSLLAISLITLSSFATAGPALAERAEWSGGRLSVVEGETFFQAVEEVDWSTAEINLLVEAGDRFLTGGDGRLEIQLAGNDILRLWHDTEVELVDLDDTVEIWTWSGSLYLRSPSRYGSSCGLKIITPEATICTSGQTLLRVDIEDDDHTVVYVIKGEAEIFTDDGALRLASAERAMTAGGEIFGPTRVDPRPWDAFMRWCRDRDISISTSGSARYLPMDAAAASDLDLYGSWVYVPAVRVHVWQPVVSVGWSPYSHGRWIRSAMNGWVWVSYEPWGWLPYHYGRWTWFSGHGWVWVPGNTWAGAWVDWAVCGDYIGWRPILYQVNHVHISIPAAHHRYYYVHGTSITKLNRRIVHLEESYIERHKVVQVVDPGHVVKTGATLRGGPEKVAVTPVGRRVTMKSDLAGRTVPARSTPARSAAAKIAADSKTIARGNASVAKNSVVRPAYNTADTAGKAASGPSSGYGARSNRPVRRTTTASGAIDPKITSFDRPARPARAPSASFGAHSVQPGAAKAKPAPQHYGSQAGARTRAPAPAVRNTPSRPAYTAPKTQPSRPTVRSAPGPSQRRTSPAGTSFSGSAGNAAPVKGREAVAPRKRTVKKKK